MGRRYHAGTKGTLPVERWLLRYRDAVANERLLIERIDRLEDHATSVTRRITGIQRTKGDGSLLPSLADERDRLQKGVEDAQAIKAEILALLRKLPDDERRLLTAYYIEGMSWEASAEFVPCSQRWVYEIKRRALRRLQAIYREQR